MMNNLIGSVINDMEQIYKGCGEKKPYWMDAREFVAAHNNLNGVEHLSINKGGINFRIITGVDTRGDNFYMITIPPVQGGKEDLHKLSEGFDRLSTKQSPRESARAI